MCPRPPWSSAWSFNSQWVSLFVLNDRQELYHGKPQWHSKASIFTTCKHQWPNLKDWLIPLLTWLGAGGCVYERQPSLFNSARCRGERVMSFKLHCYASPPCLRPPFKSKLILKSRLRAENPYSHFQVHFWVESATCDFVPTPPPVLI